MTAVAHVISALIVAGVYGMFIVWIVVGLLAEYTRARADLPDLRRARLDEIDRGRR